MPRLNNTNNAMQTLSAGSFKFSGIRPTSLGATEYTVVTIVVDITSSVFDFKDDLLAAVKATVQSCRNSPRADNLLIRLLTFNTVCKEVHGFRPLGDIDPAAYKPFKPSGMTALFDATYDAVTATNRYAKLLASQDFQVNAAIYIITDGWDNRSKLGPKHIAEEVRDARREEDLESLVTVLIGVNTGESSVRQALSSFKNEAELSQYLDVGAATPQKLAKLAAFVSQSISTQSQALGSGGGAQTLAF